MGYLIQNMKNGKKYVGQTIQPLEMRFNPHAHLQCLETIKFFEEGVK